VDPKPVEPTPFDVSADQPSEAVEPEIVTADPLQAVRAELAQLHARGTSGAGWFFWIAALSLINSIILLSGGDRHFVVGLGVTSIADAVARAVADQNPEGAGVAKGIAFGFTVFVAAVVCLFGWLSRRPLLPIFIIGMVLYLLDGLLYVLFQDWMSVGFHAFVLFGMWSGFQAYRQMLAMKAVLQQQLAAGVAPGV
jgi:hypothetical protein